MSSNGKKKTKRILLPDADVLGIAVATFVAGGVAAMGMFRLKLSFFELVFRAGLTFAVTYAAVFLLVKYVVRTMLTEMAERRRREFEQRQSQEKQAGATPPNPDGQRGETE